MIIGSKLGMMGYKAPPVHEFLYESAFGYNSNAVIFSSVPFGAATPDRLIVANVHGFRLNTVTLSGKIGGVAFTVNTQETSTTIQTYTISAVVPSGTSGNIVLNFSDYNYLVGLNVHSIKGLVSPTPYISQKYITTSGTPTLTVPTIDADSVLIGDCTSYDTSATGYTWSGLDEKNDYNSLSRVAHSSAAKYFSAAQSNLVVTANPPGGTAQRRLLVTGWK